MKRSHIIHVDIENSVRDIMSPEILLDLRLSGHLLAGIVKIFARKAKYLLTECSDIFSQIKSFRPHVTDLPESRREAHVNDITLPEVFEMFDDLDNGMPEDMLLSNQSRIEDITLAESLGNHFLLNEDDLNGLEFGKDEVMNFDDDLNFISFLNDDEMEKTEVHKNVSNQFPNINGGAQEADNMTCKTRMIADVTEDRNFGNNGCDTPNDSPDTEAMQNVMYSNVQDKRKERHMSVNKKVIKLNEKIELNLEPLQGNVGNFKQVAKRKRKLIIDQEKYLDTQKIAKQMYDTSDIVTSLDLAPPSKRLMILKSTGSADQLLHLSAQKIGNLKLFRLYQRNLKTSKNEENVKDSSDEERSYMSYEQPRSCFSGLSSDENVPLNSDFSIDPQDTNDIRGPSISNWTSNNNTNNDAEGRQRNDECNYSSNKEKQNMSEILEMYPDLQVNSSNEILSDNNVYGNEAEKWKSILQDRIIALLSVLQILFGESIEKNTVIRFSMLVKNHKKMKVSQKFLTLLVMKKFSIVELLQSNTHEEIFITKGEDFISVCAQFSLFE